MMSRSMARIATNATSVATQTQAETFNDDLPADTVRRRAVRKSAEHTTTCDCRRSLPPRFATAAPGSPLVAGDRVDESDAEEYSPPTPAIVSHRRLF
jgi:hypothetical protein